MNLAESVGFSIQAESVDLYASHGLGWLTQKGGRDPKLETPVPLITGSRSTSVQSNTPASKSLLVESCVSLLVSTALCERFSREKHLKQSLVGRFFFLIHPPPAWVEGSFRNPPQRDGQASSLRSSVRLS